MAAGHDGKKQAGASGQAKPDGSGGRRNREPQPKPEESPVRAKPPSDRGQNLKQNTRNQGYQQDR